MLDDLTVPSNSIPVNYKNFIFQTVKLTSEIFNLTLGTIRNYVNDINNTDWQYIRSYGNRTFSAPVGQAQGCEIEGIKYLSFSEAAKKREKNESEKEISRRCYSGLEIDKNFNLFNHNINLGAESLKGKVWKKKK